MCVHVHVCMCVKAVEGLAGTRLHVGVCVNRHGPARVSPCLTAACGHSRALPHLQAFTLLPPAAPPPFPSHLPPSLCCSEYWTYFLPHRVGADMAASLTDACQPISASQAKSINMIDAVLTGHVDTFVDQVGGAGGQRGVAEVLGPGKGLASVGRSV